MWYVIGVMGVIILFLLIKVSNLGYEISKVKDEGFSVVINDMMDRYINLHDRFNQAETIERDRRFREGFGRGDATEKVRQMEETERIRCNIEKQIRNNARYEIFGDRDVTIKEALKMLFRHLGLKIKQGDDIKIVKSKK